MWGCAASGFKQPNMNINESEIRQRGSLHIIIGKIQGESQPVDFPLRGVPSWFLTTTSGFWHEHVTHMLQASARTHDADVLLSYHVGLSNNP
jgi:hypothetical protein